MSTPMPADELAAINALAEANPDHLDSLDEADNVPQDPTPLSEED